MSNEEAVKMLRTMQRTVYLGNRKFEDAIECAIKALSEPLQPWEVLAAQSVLSQSEPHWIPVTENTLPKENRVVVVCGDKGTWDFGTYRGHGGNIHFWHWKKNTYKRVYWWMYKEDALPEPYKGVTYGND